jgi:hypothetical protein
VLPEFEKIADLPAFTGGVALSQLALAR